MMHRLTAIGILSLLAAGCSLPLGSPSSTIGDTSQRLRGTASLEVSTPYAKSRAFQALPTLQGTVEPENLGQLFDHITVVLDSQIQPNMTKTVPVGGSSLVRFEGLYEANDWSLTITAYTASSTPVAQFQWNQGGIATTAGKVTTLGDIPLNPIPGPGSGGFQLNLLDLPSNLGPGSPTWQLEPLNGDGSLAPPLPAGDLTKVTAVWQGRQLILGTGAQTLPTGPYRLTLHFQDFTGQPQGLSPVFVVNLYPGLTSTKTMSAASWASPLAAPAVSFPHEEVTTKSGIVVTWQPDDPTTVVGYEYVWMPGPTFPDVQTFNADLNYKTGSRSGFLAATAVNRYRPSWILGPSDITADQQVSSDWGFFVRAVSVGGSVGPWALSVVAVDVSFSLVLESVALHGGKPGHYELRRLGPSFQYPLNAPNGSIHPDLAAYPVLSRFAFDLGDPSVAPQTQTLPEPWLLAPGQQLVLVTPDGIAPVRQDLIDHTVPNQPPLALSLYEAAKPYYNEQLDSQVSETYFLAIKDTLSTMAGQGPLWSFRMASPTVVESFLASSAATPQIPTAFGSATLKYQIVPLDYQSFTSRFVPNFSLANVLVPETWVSMLWQAGNEAVTARSVVARPYWENALAGGLAVYGDWSPVGMSVGTSVAPTDVTLDATTHILTWTKVEDSTWGAAHVVGYTIDKVGGAPGLPYPMDSSASQFDATTFGPGDYTVTTVFQRADGRTGTSAPAQWPAAATLPNGVLADLGDRRPGDPGYDSTQVRGRFYDVSPDLYRTGAWLASGLAGLEGDVFLSRHLSAGALDTAFGPAMGADSLGVAYVPNGIFGGSYYDNSIGLSQSASTGQILINSYVQPGGGGYTRYSAYSFQGVEDTPNFNATNGYVTRGPNRLPAGRLVRIGTATYGLEGLEPGFGVVKVADTTGAISASGGLSASDLYRLAVKDSGTLLAIGDAGLILRISTSTLALDTTPDATVWSSSGTATVTVDGVTPNWKDIAVLGNGNIILTGWSGTNGYVVRLQSTGNLDTSFNGSGWVKLPGLYPQDLAVFGLSEVAVIGDNAPAEADGVTAFLKVFDATGTVKPWLNVVLPGTTAHGASARAVAYDASGKLMVAGFTRNSATLQDTLPALWRF